MRRVALLAIPASAIMLTCAYTPPPAPITGDAATIGFLAGEWSGTYQSEDLGRGGDIYFRLRAGADTARGEVLMAPSYPVYREHASPGEPAAPMVTRPPPVVTISFVRGSGPWINGALDVYRDPQTGLELTTTFTGRIVEDRIEGQFQSTPEGAAHPDLGTWSVRRTGPPPREDAAPLEPGARVARGTPDTLGLKGPDTDQMIEEGRVLFRDLGCSYCHGAEGRSRVAPDLAETLRHRSFGWIYRMMVNPDSMVRHDPVAASMYQNYGFEMPDRGVRPWDALVLYEYLLAEVGITPRPEPGR